MCGLYCQSFVSSSRKVTSLQDSKMARATFWSNMRNITCIAIGGSLGFGGYVFYNNDSSLHRRVTMPLFHCLDPETSHRLSIWAMRHKLLPRRRELPHASIETNLLGMKCSSPIGLAAGYDKDGEAVEGLFRLGFGLVEIGSVTPNPQPGNPKPRVFRLTENEAVINRYGFNSAGDSAMLGNLNSHPSPGNRQAPVGINLGKNKESTNPAEDYKMGVRHLTHLADYLVINVSSPNTRGLRSLESGGALAELVDAFNKN